MKLFSFIFLLFITNCYSLKVKDDKNHNTKVAENRITAQILAILDHYQTPDPVGLPGASVPDPMDVPNMKRKISVATIQMMNTKVYGLSKFRFQHMKTDLYRMTVDAGLLIDELLIKGNYTLSMFLSNSKGPFTVKLKNVYCQGNATLNVDREGKLTVEDIKLDILFSGMDMDFENLGMMGSFFQGAMNSAPNLVFDAIKPFMLAEAYTKMKAEVDTALEKFAGDNSFANSISPLDMAIAETRKKFREMGYDPFKVADYNHTIGIFAVQMSNTWVTGASSFYRVGNVTVVMENNEVTMGLQVGTQKILGSTEWEVSMGMISQAGHAQFSVDHFKVFFELSQPLDTRVRAELKDLQLELGNIQVRCDGAGTLDYLTELVVNVLPNILRYQLMDAIENPIKLRIQEEINKFDVDAFIRTNITDYIENGNASFNFDFDFDLASALSS